MRRTSCNLPPSGVRVRMLLRLRVAHTHGESNIARIVLLLQSKCASKRRTALTLAKVRLAILYIAYRKT